jgi:hypothetical protein
VFWDLGQCFGTWDSVLGPGTVFWDLGQCFGTWDSVLGPGTVFWDLGQCFGTWASCHLEMMVVIILSSFIILFLFSFDKLRRKIMNLAQYLRYKSDYEPCTVPQIQIRL